MTGGFEMKISDEELLVLIKNKLVEALSECLTVYRPDWVNRENCQNLMEDIKMGKSVIMNGPFWGDILDSVFGEFGVNSDRETYSKFLKLLKEG